MKQQLSLCPTFFLAAMLVVPAWASAQAAQPADPAAPPPDALPGEFKAADPAAPPPDALPGHFAEVRRTSTSEVVSVDPATRMITLREEGEEPQTYTLGKDVRNLDQVKPGDRVKVDYYESTSIRTLPPGEVVNEDVATLDRSEPGEKPGGWRRASARRPPPSPASSRARRSSWTRNAKGRLRTWKVRDAKQLENIRSGDRIQLTYASSLAVSVTPAPTTTTAPTATATTAPAPTAAPAAAKDPAEAPAEAPAETPAETPAPATPAPTTPAPAPPGS